jgi:hypothetical protein
MTTLLAHRINTLLLNPQAPFPSEVRDGHELVLQWRRASRLRLVPVDNRNAYRDGADSLDDGDVE